MIESIVIRNFRGIKEGKIDQFKKINLLVGPNNSGKSAVLEAIYLACTASRPASLTDEEETKSFSYSATVAEHDLLGDHPMQRVWAKHNYKTQHTELSQWSGGQIQVHQKDSSIALRNFSITIDRGFSQGDELIAAVIGIESDDRAVPDYESQLESLIGRRTRLQRLLESPFEENSQARAIESQIQNLKVEKAEAEVSVENETRLAEIDKQIDASEQELERLREKEVNAIKSSLEAAEKTISNLNDGWKSRQEKIKLLVDNLMNEDQPGFEQSRLIYCWHPSLTHFYKGDAAWIVKGDIPTASHTVLYDVSKVTGYFPAEFIQHNLTKRQGWLQQIAQSFGRVFDLTNCQVQFQPSPEDLSLMQGWIASDSQSFVPIDAHGDGARSVFKLLVALHTLADPTKSEEPGVLIWEEPELFQNPKTLGHLLEEVSQIVSNTAIQLFIASHSLESMAHFIALASAQITLREELIAFRLDLNGESRLSSVWFRFENLLAWLESGMDPRIWGDFKTPLQFSFQEVE